MNLNVLLSQRGGSQIARLVVGQRLTACARLLGSQFSVASRVSIKALDRILRRFLGIYEFSQEPGCVLRYSRARSRIAITLPGGEVVRPGDSILELHFWNDRLGASRYPGSSSGTLRFALRYSLALLAAQLQSNERFVDIKAVHATIARASSRSCRVHHLFGCALYSAPRSNARRIHDYFENFLIHSLRWAFNPRIAKQRSLRLNRVELWVAVSDLVARFVEARHSNIAWITGIDESPQCEQFMPEERKTVEATGD